jgi:hypothetical protein
LQLQHICRGLAATLFNRKLVSDLLALDERRNSGALDCANVHEDVCTTGFRLNEAKALVRIEPFDDANLHEMSSPGAVSRRFRNRDKSIFWGGSHKPDAPHGGRGSKIIWPKLDIIEIKQYYEITMALDMNFVALGEPVYATVVPQRSRTRQRMLA